MEGITDVVPAQSTKTTAQERTRVSFPAKAVLSYLQLQQEKAKVPLQLVVKTGNIQVTTAAFLEDRVLRKMVDLEGDYVKWMRRKLNMDMQIARRSSWTSFHVRGRVNGIRKRVRVRIVLHLFCCGSS